MTYCGFISILGLTNVGKSTLVNALTGAKVTIVSPKVQTTRHQIRGILTEEDRQIVFIDTPGLFKPRRRLDEAMIGAAWQALQESDVCLLVIDANRPNLKVIDSVFASRRPKRLFVAFNKVDQVDKPDLLRLASHVAQSLNPEKVFMISALREKGLSDLRRALFEALPESPWFYDPESLTDQSQRMWASEITREQLYLQLHEELPYDTWVETLKWENLADGSALIHQTIYVNKSAQKKIVVGAHGSRIKEISEKARHILAQELDHPVHLYLHVKVQDNWSERSDIYQYLGLSHQN